MKYLKTIALAILLGAILSVSAYADGKPSNGGPGNGKPGNPGHYGLSDSCWNVFLSQISPADAGRLAADQATITANQTQIDALNQKLMTLLKGTGGKRDTTGRAAIMDLQKQIGDLQKANGAAQMDADGVIKANGTLFETVAQNCGRPDKGNPKDTTKRPPPDKRGRGHFGLSDSCWNIFLTQISPADAAQLAADQKTITDAQTQVNDLLKQIRALKGSAKDSATRAQIKALLDQIKAIMQKARDAEKDYASIIKKNDTILQSIRKDCGRTGAQKGGPGDPSNGFQIGEIIPNPAGVGTMPTLSITLTADAPVTIMIASAVANGTPAKQIFNGSLTAGTHVQSLDLAGFGPGIYLVNVQSGNENVTKKLVIQ